MELSLLQKRLAKYENKVSPIVQETTNLARSRKYDISVVELVVDAEGNGSGTAIPAVQVDSDESTGDIVVENLSSSPVQLSKVRRID
jgi:hypothetical protein